MKTEWEEIAVTGEERVVGLFAHYTRLRQAGENRDTAWVSIEDELRRLPPATNQRLLSMLRGWEAKEGRYFRLNDDNQGKTHTLVSDGLAEVRQKMNASNKKVIRRISPVTKPVPDVSGIECPACHARSANGSMYCSTCGTLLETPQPHDSGETRPLMDAAGKDSSYFDESMLLYVRVRGEKAMLRVRPGSSELIVGRRSPDSVMLPDIDLSDYQADIKGVSRLHAGLRRHGNTLVLTDMGSLNHTHVNGHRLHAHEVRALHDGDEIRLGQLTFNVYFRPD